MSADSVGYQLVYSVLREGYRQWWFPAVGVIPVAAGVGFLLAGKWTDSKGTAVVRVFGGLLGGIAVLWTLAAFASTYPDYSKLRRALETGRYVTVEGEVKSFVPGDFGDHQLESFTVAGHRFSYSPSIVTAGFSTSRPHAGPLHGGLWVRIAEVDGEIARLEIARHRPLQAVGPTPTQGPQDWKPRAKAFAQCWPLLIVLAAWIWSTFLAFRVSAFRIDRPANAKARYFGMPLLGSWKYLNPSNFTERGRPLVRLIWFAQAAFLVGALLAISLCF